MPPGEDGANKLGDVVELVAELCGALGASVVRIEGGAPRVVAAVGPVLSADLLRPEVLVHELPVPLTDGLFVVGTPVRDEDGEVLGALVVLDTAPPALTAIQRKTLRTLAARIAHELRDEVDARPVPTRRDVIRSLDAAGVVTWAVDVATEFTYCSPGLCHLFGLPDDTPEFVPASVYIDAVHAEDRAAVRAALEASSRTGERFEVEFRATGRDGAERRVVSRGEVTFGEDGRPLRVAGVIIDLTELRRAEAERERLARELLAAEAKFRAAQEDSPDGFVVMESIRDDAGEIVDFRWIHANESASRMMALPHGWLPGRRMLDEFPANRETGLFEMYRMVAETGEPRTFETPYHADGLDLYIRLAVTKVDDGFAATFADLSASRQAEERTRESEERLALAVEAAGAGVWSLDLDTGSFTASDRALSLHGLRSGETLDHERAARAVHPEDRERVKAGMERTIETGEPFRSEHRVLGPEKETRWALSHARRHQGVAGPRVLGFVTDVTERRRAEDELRGSEARARLAADAAGLAVWEWNASDDQVRWHGGRPHEIFGVSPDDEPVNAERFVREFAHPDDAPRFAEAVARALGEDVTIAFTGRIVRPDGEIRWVEFTGRRQTGADGAAARLIGTAADATARMRSEARDRFLLDLDAEVRALDDPEAIVRATVERLGAHMGVDWSEYAEVEPDGESLRVRGEFTGPGATPSPGIDRLSSFGPEAGGRLAAGETVALGRTGDGSALRDAAVGAALVVPVKRDGKLVATLATLSSRERAWDPADAELCGLVASRIWEGVERARAARDLAESEASLRRFVETANEGILRIGPDDRVAYANDHHTRMLGYEPGETVGMPITSFIFDEDREMVSRRRRDRARGKNERYEMRLRGKDGREIWVLNSTVVVKEGGRYDGTYSMISDITERKRAEDALRGSEARYRTLFETIDEGFCVVQVIRGADGSWADYRFLEVNPAFTKFTGISVEDALSGRPISDLVPGLEPFWAATYGRVAETGRAIRFEQSAAALGRFYDLHASRVGDEGSDRVAVVFNDATERKAAEREQARLVAELSAEQAKLRSLFEQAPAFLALLRGGEFRFEYVNEAYYGLVGHREIIGRTVAEAIPEAESQGYMELLRGVLETSQPFAGSEMAISLQRTPGGAHEERYLDFVFQPVRSPNGTVDAILAHGIDVTEGVLARRAVAESEERFRTVFENAPDDAIVITDPERRIIAFNPAAERVLGWTAGEVIGQPIDVIFTPEDQAADVPARETAAAARDGKSLDERWHIRKGGERFWGSGTMNALKDPTDGVRGFLKIFRDATERHEMERRVRALNEELEARVAERTAALVAKNEELEGFTYSVSHDMRAPLRAIVGRARMVLEDEGPNVSPEGRGDLERLAKAASQMSQLVDDLLQYARLGKRELRREQVSWKGLVEEVAAQVHADRPDDPLELSVTCDTEMDCDPRVLGMALHNIIDNACKYRKKGESARVEVGCEEGGVFFVRDEGIGFDMQYVGKLFQPFERLHREEYVGTGIGLANVRRAIERHGGRVWAEGAVGVGTTIFFTVPPP